MTSLELTLSKIPELRKPAAARLRADARAAGNYFRSRAKSFLPPTPSTFCPLAQNGLAELS